MRLKMLWWVLIAVSMLPLSIPLKRISSEESQSIIQRYGTVPKGVVVEGSATGIDEITSLGYEKKADEFIINETFRYKNPVSRKDWSRIFKSLRKSDNLGVTLKEGEVKAYGSLDEESKIIKAMAETDKFFGGIIYGIPRLLEGHKIPGGYTPQFAENRTVAVVAFARLINWKFVKNGQKYESAGCSLDIQLIPMSDQKTKSGGHLPDKEKMKSYVMEETDRKNVEHIKSNQQEYFKISFIAITVQAGEAAAFARLVRDSKALDADKVLKMLD
jgi:hypothetical protein